MANETALLPVQAALLDVLAADAALMAEINGVHDHVPEDVAYPYVTVGDAVETPDNLLAEFGSRVATTVHIWSGHRGFAEALAILDHLMRLLDYQPLTVAGRQVAAVRHEQTITMRDPDPDVRHIAARFVFDTYQQQL